MNKAGIIILFLTGALAGLSLVVWLLGLLTGFTLGGLIHLLLVFALLVAPAGVAVGVILLILGRRQGARPAGPR